MTHTAANAISHTAHAMEPRVGRFEARAVISSVHAIHFAAMALAHIAGTLAMNLLVVGVLGVRHGVA